MVLSTEKNSLSYSLEYTVSTVAYCHNTLVGTQNDDLIVMIEQTSTMYSNATYYMIQKGSGNAIKRNVVR